MRRRRRPGPFGRHSRIESLEERVLLDAAQPVRIIDDGDPGFSSVGAGWRRLGETYRTHNGDLLYHTAGTGAATAEWNFDAVPPGWYDLSVSWLPQSNRANNVLYHIFDGDTLMRSVLADQQSTISGIVDGTQRWHSLGRYQSIDGRLRVVVSNEANGIVTVDAVRLAPLPELRTSANEPLWSLSTLQLGDRLSSDRPLTLELNSQAAHDVLLRWIGPNGLPTTPGGAWQTIPAMGTANLELPVDVAKAGPFSETARLEIFGHGADLWPMTITGVVTAEQSADQGNQRFTTVGNWQQESSPGSQGGNLLRLIDAQSGDFALWRFDGLRRGLVELQVTLPPGDATTAGLYRISVEDVPPLTVTAAELSTRPKLPGGFTTIGRYRVNSAVEVRLVATTTGETLVADAVRLVQIPSLETRLVQGNRLLQDGDTVSFGADNSPRTIEFTNRGSAPLTMPAILRVPYSIRMLAPDGLRVTGEVHAPFGESPLAPGESRRLMFERNPAAATHEPASLLIDPEGTDVAALTIRFVDPVPFDAVQNGTATPGWVFRSRPWDAAVANDFQYAHTGWGAVRTSWSFNQLVPGTYEIWTTWIPGSNRSAAAAFEWTTGADSTATAWVDQRLAPDDGAAFGLNWERIASVTVTGESLTVSLTNRSSAAGYVVADAIRLTRSTVTATDSRFADAGQADDSVVGPGWIRRAAGWYQTVNRDFFYASAAASTTAVRWNVPNLAAGNYEVLATFLAGENRTTDARYGLLVGGFQVATASMNQRLAPDDTVINGLPFERLGVVRLTNAADLGVTLSGASSTGIVVADAILVRPLSEISGGVSVQVGVLGEGHPRSGETVRLFASAPTGTPWTYRFHLQDPSGNWRLVRDFSPNPVWPWNSAGAASGSWRVRAEIRHPGTGAVSTAVTRVDLRPTADQLWDATVLPLLQEDLWYFDYRYDAANFLMLPMLDAFQSEKTSRIQDFADHFARLAAHGSEDNGLQGELSWLQYLSLPGRFLAESARHGRLDVVPAGLVDFVYGELERYWSLQPSWHWTLPNFDNMRARLEWKLTAENLERSYYAAVIDHELFIMMLAADLATYERHGGGTHPFSDSVSETLAVARRVFEQRGTWDGNRWLFQVGVWDDLIEFAYIGHAEIADDLLPAPRENTAPDSAHAHRLPALLASLLNAQEPDSDDWRFYDAIRAGHANQFIERVLVAPTADFAGYRMTNYMDGVNGLYRYGRRANRPDPTAYAPYELSGRFLYGWWTLLGDSRITQAYQRQARLFPPAGNVHATYNGPPDFRPTHELTRLENAYTNGFLELTTILAGQLAE